MNPSRASEGDTAAASAWTDAVWAAALLSVDPQGLGGIVVRARPGPVRDLWLDLLRRSQTAETPIRRLPIGTLDDRLIGGLDLAATLQAGRPVARRGVLAEADGGLVIAAMAERMEPGIAARIAAVLDRGEVIVEREGFASRTPTKIAIIALDESADPDEHVPAALVDRLSILIDIDAVSTRDAVLTDAIDLRDIEAARGRLARVEVSDEIIRSLCVAAELFGVASLRAPLAAVALARAAAALADRDEVIAEDAALAARLVIAPRATRMPAPPENEAPPNEPPPPPPPDQSNSDPSDTPPPEDPAKSPPLDDMILQAASAALPERLLASLASAAKQRAGAAGRAGAKSKGARRGRPMGVRPGNPGNGYRLSLIDTLRAAAPWQRLRKAEGSTAGSIAVRRADFRIKRFEHQSETNTIFVVDASGSAAIHRLAESKGAVELLLAECYVRRDRVALIAFRGNQAETVLAPTRSLVRAKRQLSGLPGGGGTPLASAIDSAALLVRDVRRKGGTAVVVFLTDARANIDRAGNPDRAKAMEDALASARALSELQATVLFVDTAQRSQEPARVLASAMRATYLPLPFARSDGLADAVRAAVEA